MRRFLAACVAALVAASAAAFPARADYVAPPPGTVFTYGVFEGGETATVTRTLSVVASDPTGFVARDNEGRLVRNHYGFAESPCEIGAMYGAADLAAAIPFRAGTELADGFFFVIGPDQQFVLDGRSHATWAVRQWTEHGSTWVTRVAPGLGAPVDDLVRVEVQNVPAHESAEAAACLAQ